MRRRSLRRRTLPAAARAAAAACLVALFALGLAGAARAQVGASLTAVSDFRLRGVSLSDRRAALTLAISSDQADGLYFGGSATVTRTAHEGTELLGHTEYIGYTRRGAAGPALDIGISRQDYRVYLERRYTVGYTQVYAGLIGENMRAHVSWLPNYPRDGVDAIYTEADAAMRPAEHWRISAHAGVLSRVGGAYDRDGPRRRADVRAGLAREFERGEVELSWTAVSPRPRQHPDQARSGLVASASLFF
jgi:uncharacterized protein (TIGR02001 family)